jgi:hypothetical protein
MLRVAVDLDDQPSAAFLVGPVTDGVIFVVRDDFDVRQLQLIPEKGQHLP